MIGISLLVGCKSYTCRFPTEINSVAHGCKNEAKAKIDSVTGKSLKMKADCNVTERPGEVNFNGRWCWYMPQFNAYVDGSCSGKDIVIACNPNNRADISVPTLTHEMAHYWLMTSYGIRGHDTRFDNSFIDWKYSRDVTGMGYFTDEESLKESIKILYQNMKIGETLPMTYYDDKTKEKLHIDFIKIK
jgi:hypothetical protein